MKKQLTLLMIIMMGCTALFAMGQKPAGAITTKTGMDFSLKEVDRLMTSSDWQIEIVEGSRAGVHIDHGGDRKGWLFYDGDQLRFGVEPRIGMNLDFKPHRATVTLPGLPSRLEASSSSSIEVSFSGEAGNLLVDGSSSSRITLRGVRAGAVELKGSSSARIGAEELICDTLKVSLSSSSRVSLEGGSASELITDLTSSSGFYGEDFLVTHAFRIKGSSSSKQEFRISGEVEAWGDLSSSSLLVLHGDPSARTVQEIRTSSSARVRVE